MNGPSHNTRILLVEDSDDDAFFFDWALAKTKWPCECVRVVDGLKAVDHLEKSRQDGTLPHVIFLDLKLPAFSGFDVLKWIGGQNFQPSLHVVILSGSDHEEDIRMSRELGAADYLVKPASWEDLRKRLEAIPPVRASACASHEGLRIAAR